MTENTPTPPAVTLGPNGQPNNPEILERRENTPSPPPAGTKPNENEKPAADPSLLNQKDPSKEGEKPAAGAPEKYEAFKLPEGVQLAEASVTEATAVFKELGLSQEGAQKLVDFHTKVIKDAAEAPVKLWRDTQQEWQTELKNHPELGGKLNEVKTTVTKAIDAVAGPELGQKFRQVMDYTGAGNNPVFAEVMYKMAALLTEGGHVAGGKPSPLGQTQPGSAPPSAAHALYPKLT